MESEKLEITLHSAKGLFDVKFFGTMDPYAIVWIAGDGKESQRRKTGVATKGGCSPIWNCPMKFNLAPMHKNYTLLCEIKHDGKLFDRDIGEVQVPFSDLLVGNGSGEKLSYPVRIYSGEVNGEIILSHKFSKPMSVRSSGEKSGDNSGGKVDGGGPRKKVKGKKKVNGKKKKDGMMKKIAGNVATKVVTEVVTEVGIMAATVALALGLDYVLDGEEENHGEEEDDGEDDEYEYEDEDDGEDDEYEEGDEDEDEDDGEDDEYEDEYEDEDEY